MLFYLLYTHFFALLTLSFKIGRIVSSSCIYDDAVPYPNNISVGTKVLFKQGRYRDNMNQIAFRWHEGVVTQVHVLPGGARRFTGHHTKGHADKKSFTFHDSSYFFDKYSCNDLRLCLSDFVEASDISTGVGSSMLVTRDKTPVDLEIKPRLSVGDRVIVEYKKQGRFFSAAVQQFLANSEFLVSWDDKSLQQNLQGKYFFYLKSNFLLCRLFL